MKNLTTRYFCRNFGACTAGTRFALRYKTMRECYTALLTGEAGDKSAEWAIWAATRDGVMSDRDLRLFAVRCARRAQHLMKDQRSIAALDVAERYAKGETVKKELAAAWNAACYAAGDATGHTAWNAARAAAYASDDEVCVVDYVAHASARAVAYASADAVNCNAAWNAAYDTERREQLKILAEFGNPFEED